MSELVHYTGEIKVIPKYDYEETPEYFKRVANNNGLETDEFYDSYEELIQEKLSDKFIIHNGAIYEIISKLKDDSTSNFMSRRTIDSDGTLSYEYNITYYNGECSFNKALEKALLNSN